MGFCIFCSLGEGFHSSCARGTACCIRAPPRAAPCHLPWRTRTTTRSSWGSRRSPMRVRARVRASAAASDCAPRGENARNLVEAACAHAAADDVLPHRTWPLTRGHGMPATRSCTSRRAGFFLAPSAGASANAQHFVANGLAGATLRCSGTATASRGQIWPSGGDLCGVARGMWRQDGAALLPAQPRAKIHFDADVTCCARPRGPAPSHPQNAFSWGIYRVLLCCVCGGGQNTSTARGNSPQAEMGLWRAFELARLAGPAPLALVWMRGMRRYC